MDQILDLLPGSTCNFQLFSWRYVQMFENFPGHACNSLKFWTFLVLKGYFGPISIQMDQCFYLFLGVTFNRFHSHMFKCLKFSLLSVQYTKFWTFLIQKANFGPFCIKMENKNGPLASEVRLEVHTFIWPWVPVYSHVCNCIVPRFFTFFILKHIWTFFA